MNVEMWNARTASAMLTAHSPSKAALASSPARSVGTRYAHAPSHHKHPRALEANYGNARLRRDVLKVQKPSICDALGQEGFRLLDVHEENYYKQIRNRIAPALEGE